MLLLQFHRLMTKDMDDTAGSNALISAICCLISLSAGIYLVFIQFHALTTCCGDQSAGKHDIDSDGDGNVLSSEHESRLDMSSRGLPCRGNCRQALEMVPPTPVEPADIWSPSPNYSGLPIAPLDQSDFKGVRRSSPCERFSGDITCQVERDEWLLAAAFIRPGDTVLELGARWGTTSCALARMTNNSGSVVAVEPDQSVHRALLVNRHVCRGNFHIVRGSVGDFDLRLSKGLGPSADNYGIVSTRVPGAVAGAVPSASHASAMESTSESASASAAWSQRPARRRRVPRLSLDEVESHLGGRKIDTVLLDCEGGYHSPPLIPADNHWFPQSSSTTGLHLPSSSSLDVSLSPSLLRLPCPGCAIDLLDGASGARLLSQASLILIEDDRWLLLTARIASR